MKRTVKTEAKATPNELDHARLRQVAGGKKKQSLYFHEIVELPDGR